MSLRFAAARHGNFALVARVLSVRAPTRGANDNGRPIGALIADPLVLRETLVHFARYGLGAADAARSEAIAAFADGDEDTARRWLAICRQLDRRLAKRLEAQVAPRGR